MAGAYPCAADRTDPWPGLGHARRPLRSHTGYRVCPAPPRRHREQRTSAAASPQYSFVAAAETLRVPMPLGSLLHDRFLRLLAEGGEQLDWAAIGGLAARDAGAPPRV